MLIFLSLWSLCVLGGVSINIDKLIHTMCIYRHVGIQIFVTIWLTIPNYIYTIRNILLFL